MFSVEAFENSFYDNDVDTSDGGPASGLLPPWTTSVVPRKIDGVNHPTSLDPTTDSIGDVYNWIFDDPNRAGGCVPTGGPHPPSSMYYNDGFSGNASGCSSPSRSGTTPQSMRKTTCASKSAKRKSRASHHLHSWNHGALDKSALSKFTLHDENGKRKIRNDIMSIAESLPSLPGLYFDKKQKGFRVRYQNVYVGWVALSRFPSIEEAYCSARDIWENAKAHAEKFQTPQAAIIASLPLQKQAKAAGKNRGGRPRTVTQLPAEWSTPANPNTAVDASSPNNWYCPDSIPSQYPPPHKFNEMFPSQEDQGIYFGPSPISYGKPVSDFN